MADILRETLQTKIWLQFCQQAGTIRSTQRNLLEKRSENWSRKVFICVLIICGFTAGGGVFFERYLNEQIYKERVSQLTESTQLLYTNLENTLDSE